MRAGDGQYPRGRLNVQDEGAVEVAITVDQDCVVIAFPKQIAWIGMPAEMAEQLADALREKAAIARMNRQ
jgi:hypothetical protein